MDVTQAPGDAERTTLPLHLLVDLPIELRLHIWAFVFNDCTLQLLHYPHRSSVRHTTNEDPNPSFDTGIHQRSTNSLDPGFLSTLHWPDPAWTKACQRQNFCCRSLQGWGLLAANHQTRSEALSITRRITWTSLYLDCSSSAALHYMSFVFPELAHITHLHFSEKTMKNEDGQHSVWNRQYKSYHDRYPLALFAYFLSKYSPCLDTVSVELGSTRFEYGKKPCIILEAVGWIYARYAYKSGLTLCYSDLAHVDADIESLPFMLDKRNSRGPTHVRHYIRHDCFAIGALERVLRTTVRLEVETIPFTSHKSMKKIGLAET